MAPLFLALSGLFWRWWLAIFRMAMRPGNKTPPYFCRQPRPGLNYVGTTTRRRRDNGKASSITQTGNPDLFHRYLGTRLFRRRAVLTPLESLSRVSGLQRSARDQHADFVQTTGRRMVISNNGIQITDAIREEVSFSAIAFCAIQPTARSEPACTAHVQSEEQQGPFPMRIHLAAARSVRCTRLMRSRSSVFAR